MRAARKLFGRLLHACRAPEAHGNKSHMISLQCLRGRSRTLDLSVFTAITNGEGEMSLLGYIAITIGEPEAAARNIGPAAPYLDRRMPVGVRRQEPAGAMLRRPRVDRRPNLKCNRRSEHRNRAEVWIRRRLEPMAPHSTRAGTALLQTSRLSLSGTPSTRSKRLRARTETPARRRERSSPTVAKTCTGYQCWSCPQAPLTWRMIANSSLLKSRPCVYPC
jgi:hypothetical protein